MILSMAGNSHPRFPTSPEASCQSLPDREANRPVTTSHHYQLCERWTWRLGNSFQAFYQNSTLKASTAPMGSCLVLSISSSICINPPYSTASQLPAFSNIFTARLPSAPCWRPYWCCWASPLASPSRQHQGRCHVHVWSVQQGSEDQSIGVWRTGHISFVVNQLNKHKSPHTH